MVERVNVVSEVPSDREKYRMRVVVFYLWQKKLSRHVLGACRLCYFLQEDLLSNFLYSSNTSISVCACGSGRVLSETGDEE